ncbi:glycosyltransferase family 2 protein [Tamlana sp. 2_MG-2023]|uniref:glycosyltransferase family 2 protein n=1 Tax=unclassified Tamlana TaxID=2614803 RepID=UPI0026E3F0FB|nr:MULTISPECIES: glycosyltransferase family 2 protein [unclassified Tamlana]MDO6759068.1 glycosyltransferase family 2 protein [Tamlana sp. 2_MG-2023]MDO6789767.1 glycosyltransferase family 2 protein [Tamlana sp. 1_MG-2023]
MYQIAVILINYNSSSFTINAVKSLIKNTSKALNWQLIIVDNASTYEDYTKLKEGLPEMEHLTLFRSRLNTGFGGGNMLGIHFVNAKYYAFINNDTLLKNDCLSDILTFMENHPKVALCAPQGYDEHDNVLKSFDHFLTLKRELFGRKILEKTNPKKYPKRNKKYEKPIKVDCIPGSFMFVDAKVFDSVGGFDTNIFLYYEETDLAYRIGKLKDRSDCYLVPSAQYIHFKGKSTSPNIKVKKELKLSLLYVLKKNSGYFHYLILKTTMVIKYLIKSIVKPKQFTFVNLLLFQGASLSKSLKHSQKILEK